MNILMAMYGRSVGGAELQFIELAEYLLKQGHKIRLLSFGGDVALSHVNISKDIETWVKPYSSGKVGVPIALISALSDKNNSKFDVVISTSGDGNIFSAIYSKIHNCPAYSLQTVSKAQRNTTLVLRV